MLLALSVHSATRSPRSVVPRAIDYRNSKPYSYKSIRRNCRVTNEYQCSGEFGVLMWALELIKMDKHTLVRLDALDERDELKAVEAPIREYCDDVENLTRAALLAAGFHQNKCQWRRGREPRLEG
jgi:hypothetical protein